MSKTKNQTGYSPALPPPVRSIGPLAWLRQNLFSTPLNAALTLATIYFLYLGISLVLDWLWLDAVWNADSRVACREISTGACWAFIKTRFSQFIFGFYPEAERWRLVLAFLLLIPALTPLLWDKTPHRKNLLRLSYSYPLIAFLLIHGPIDIASLNTGSPDGGYNLFLYVWFALLVLGISAGSGFIFKDPRARGAGKFVAGFVLITMVLSKQAWGDTLSTVTSDQYGGVMLTLVIGLTGITASLPIGILLALGRRSEMVIIRVLSIVYIEFFRGVPLITLLFVAHVMLNYFLPPGTTFDLLVRVLIMVTIFSSAYLAEVIRGGLQAIPPGQQEAANAMGLGYWPTMRLIILPQALKISIPGIVNSFIALFKDTTLVTVIGLLDPLGIGRSALSDSKWSGLSSEVYLFVAIFFFICCFAMSRYSIYLEKRLHTGN